MSEPGQAALIEKLALGHNTNEFDCGKDELNRFLKRYALVSQQAHGTQTYVATRAGRVVGYYSLAVGGVEHGDAPPRVGKGLARHPVPVMVLARLAINRTEQGRGLGKGLFKDGLIRTAAAAEIAGIRALFVTARDDDAMRFYERFNLDQGPGDPHHLFLVMKDLKQII